MFSLEPPDSFHLQAAAGWLELGDPVSAAEELDRITPELRLHPDVLEAQWEIYGRTKKWDECLRVSRLLVGIAPDRESGFVYLAQAFYRLNRYQESFESLSPALGKFPDSPYVKYDLACYHCLLGRRQEAQDLLLKAIAIGGDNFKLQALADPDLEPLRDTIQGI